MPRLHKDRPCVQDAIKQLRLAHGFVLLVDLPDPNRQRVEAAIRRGDPPPSEVKVFSSPEFRPVTKTMRVLAEVLHGLWSRHGSGNGRVPPPPVQLDGQLRVQDGKLTLGPRELHHIVFATEDNYGEQITLLAIRENVPPGKQPGEGETSVVHTCVSAITVDQAQAAFAVLEVWAREQVPAVAGRTGWGTADVAEMVDLGLVQLRKAWEQEEAA